MKNAYKTTLKAAIVLAIGLWILSKIPFYSNIDQEITANIYENGIVTGETIVFMKGERSNYIFTNAGGSYSRQTPSRAKCHN